MKLIQDGRGLFGNMKKGFYSLIPNIEPGLFVDVGAAAGGITKMFLDRSPSSQVIAFEPFPGNIPYFEKSVGNDKRVTLLQKAVSDKPGVCEFSVGKTVEGTEPGWEHRVGYSSGGMLASPGEPVKFGTIKVETCALDDVIDSHVRLLKIDVQGGELGVLRGAQKLIDKGDVDMIYTEYSGQKGLIDFAFDNDFVVYDSEYLLVTRKPDQATPDWEIVGSQSLSSGSIALKAWPKNPPRTAAEYEVFMASQRPSLMVAQTDLVAVHVGYLPKFFEALASTK